MRFALHLTHAVSKNRVDVSWILNVQSTAGVFPRLFFFNSPIEGRAPEGDRAVPVEREEMQNGQTD